MTKLELPLSSRVATGCAVASGLLYWLAFAGMDVWPLTFIAWVPFVTAWEGFRRAGFV